MTGVTLTWLGQAGFLLRSAEATVLVDACLTGYDGRRYPPPIDPSSLSDVDIVLCTHEHWDHLDGPAVAAVAAASPQARVVVPLPVVDQAVAAGVPAERVVGAVPDEPLTDLAAPVFPVPARHGVEIADAYTFGLADGEARYLGYVLELGGARVYHAGDTVWWPGQEETLRRLGVHVALLPINGRDHVREAEGIVGNLDHREAALIAHHAGVDLLVPMHWDLFAGNRGFPDQLLSTIDGLDLDVSVLVPRRMKPFHYVRPT